MGTLGSKLFLRIIQSHEKLMKTIINHYQKVFKLLTATNNHEETVITNY
jgi:hypothetical protein